MFSKKKLRSSGGGYNDIDPNTIDINERFSDACENGDYPTVKRILNAIKDFNIEIYDNLGRTPLRLAVENEHLEVVLALIVKSDSAKIREALLLAIFLGHTHIAESILKHPKYKILGDKKFNGDSDSFWSSPSSDDAQFPPDITPLILASQYNRTEIVQILLTKGDRITKPHDFDCQCMECSNRFKFDSLRHAQSRLNSYRGMASESYISLVSVDPILTAFDLRQELLKLSTKEKFFKTEYITLANNLSMFTVKLLNSIRGRDELEIVLNKTGKEGEEKYERLARLALALKYHEKPFVAHPNCQQKLVEIWYTGIRPVSKMGTPIVALLSLVFVIAMPFLMILYMIAPKTKVGRFMCQPCVKFISHTITYIVFILLIIISSLQFAQDEKQARKFSNLYPALMPNFTDYVNNVYLKYRFNENDFYLRSSFPSNIDFVISIWIFGLLWHEVKQIYSDGYADYLLSTNNIVDFSMIILYISSFALKYYSIFMVRIYKNKIESNEFWNTLNNLNTTDEFNQKQIFEAFYWLNEDRFYWVSFDPINMGESLFAVANLFSFSRICFLLPANQNLGPLQITLGKMINDVFKFIVIFVVIFLAFLFSINNLYWYYPSSVRSSVQITDHINPNTNDSTTNAEKAFGTIDLTFKTIFWSIFGLGDATAIQLKPFNNSLTEFFGFFLYGTYHISSIIVLLNMLIAMMTKSYESILLDSDVEWKFSRSQLYMESISEGATLPVPFNIIPTPKTIYYIIKKIKRMILNKKGMENENVDEDLANKNNKNKPKSDQKGEELNYRIVIKRIIKRFLLHNQRDSDNAYERNFEELKQDLQMMRYEMINDLKRSKEESFQHTSLIHGGLTLLGEHLLKNSDYRIKQKFVEYKNYGNEMREMYKDELGEHTSDGNSSSDQNENINESKKALIKTAKKLKIFDVVDSALKNSEINSASFSISSEDCDIKANKMVSIDLDNEDKISEEGVSREAIIKSATVETNQTAFQSFSIEEGNEQNLN